MIARTLVFHRLRPAFRILLRFSSRTRGGAAQFPMLPDTGILSRWNCYPLDTSGSAALIYLPFVVGPITTHLLH